MRTKPLPKTMRLKTLSRLIASSAHRAQGRVSGSSVVDNRAFCDFVHTVKAQSVANQNSDGQGFLPLPSPLGTVASTHCHSALFILDFYASAPGRGISFEPAPIQQR